MSSTKSPLKPDWSFQQIEQIDAICAEFERGWNAGSSQAIEGVIARHAGLPRSLLLRELIHLERRLLLARGGSPKLEEYLRRFPEDRETIAGIWREFPSTSCPVLVPTESMTTETAPERPLPLQLDRFEIRRKLGEGGFGAVYLAHDPRRGGEVALKVLHRRLIDSPERRAAVSNEFRVGKTLKHPHLVETYEIVDAGEQVVIAQQFVEGSNLSDWCRDNRPGAHQVARIMVPVAEALAYLHEQGYTHRDLKPANILIDKDLHVYVADFGLALHEDEQRTHKGEIAGTAPYMSPEQIRRQAHLIDGQSDIWSVGVILYRLLTDRLPFGGPPPRRESEEYAEYRHDLEQEILDHDPRPPCMIRPGLSRTLQDICLRCLEKRKRHRYQTAHDLADDLALFLVRSGDHSENTVLKRRIRVVPKGLRSFDAADAEFFLELLPGPRTSAGLPSCVNFWRTRLSGTRGTEPIDAGVIYGPSGCGKSSLVKAGLLPVLGEDFLPLVVEASAEHTEDQLVKTMRHALPELSASDSLIEVCRRTGQFGGANGRKVLLVLDQFEQWLYSHPDARDSELLAALRFCNGARFQILFLVRDDFWMPLTRFMERFEISLQDNVNLAAVDLFDRDHARNILLAFGRAYGRLPDECEPTDDQSLFLDAAIEGLAEGGRIICVRLALFAEMMKDRPWTPAELAAVGGAKGVGVSFLEQQFGRSAPAACRAHGAAARRVLDCLLPEHGSEIKGRMRTAGELREVAGYSTTRAFDRLIQILVADLKLLAPTAPENPDGLPVTAGDEPRGYELTHDYLVPSIREWLTTELGRTRAGRIRLRLRERADDWNRRPESRRLPRFWETAQIALMTKSSTWTDPQSRMMRQAYRHYGRRVLASGFMLAFVLIVGTVWYQHHLQSQRRRHADAAVEQLLEIEINRVIPVLHGMQATRDLWTDRLRRMADQADVGPNEKLRAELALVAHNRQRLPELLRLALNADAASLRVVREWLAATARPTRDEIGKISQLPQQSAASQLRLAALSAEFDPDDDRFWQNAAHPVVDHLVTDPGLDAEAWAELLMPVRDRLASALCEAYLNDSATPSQRTSAAQLLARLGSTEMLCQSALEANAASLPLLFRPLLRDRITAIRTLQEAPSLWDPAIWPGDRQCESPPPELASLFSDARGELCATHGWFARLPLELVDQLLSQCKAAGYRPVCLRFDEALERGDASETPRWVSGAFCRDAAPTVFAHGMTTDEFQARDTELRREGFVPCDFSVSGQGDAAKVLALWRVKPTWATDAAVYLNIPESQHEASWRPLNERGFVPVANFKQRLSGSGEGAYSSIRWKCRAASVYVDEWEAPWRQVERNSLPGWTLMDLRLCRATGDAPQFSGVWWSNSEFVSACVPLVSAAEHAAQATRLEQAGYRPVSVSACIDEGGSHRVASLWRRPIALDEQRLLESRRASRRAVLLSQLGEPSELSAALRQAADPTLRSIVIHEMAESGIPASQLVAMLEASDAEQEQDGILLSLALSSAISTDADSKPRLESWFRSAQQATRPFLGSAARLLAERRQAPALHGPNENVARPALSPRISQFVNGQKQRFIRVERTEELWMGASVEDRERDPAVELQHRVRIPRDFYVQDREVTVDEFLQFLPDFDYAPGFSPTANCPINMVSWVDCIKYCRWLSEQEGIPAEEMCYPAISEIDRGVALPDDFLSRTGYRLPTEAEWEHACRAGTLTPRPFGNMASFLPEYAWTAANSQFRAHPVAETLPNARGLFDMLGNVMEWCHDPYEDYPRSPGEIFVDSGRGGLSFQADGTRVVRGGAFLFAPSSARSSQRYPVSTNRRLPYMGFRLARTCPQQ